MRHTLLIASLVSLSAGAAAEVKFDVIHYQTHSVPSTGIGMSRGILVNTGTDPILVEDWNDALSVAFSDEPFPSFHCAPGGANWTVLQPGEAAGRGAPELLALLEPGEVFTDTFVGALSYSVWSLGGPALTTPAQVRVDIECLGQSMRLEYGLDFEDNGLSNPIRVSSTPGTTSVETVMQACEHPTIGVLDLEVDAFGGVPAAPTVVSVESSLPALGNEHFGFRLRRSEQIFTEPLLSYIGSTYAFWVTPDGPPLDFLGCEIVNVGAIIAQEVGVLEGLPPFGEILAPIEMRLPIPNVPVLAGASFQAQWALATSDAANGLGTLSPALRVTVVEVGD